MPITKKTIAIIGADGRQGAAIAKNISGGNYRLLLLSKEIAKVQPLAEEIAQFESTADVDAMKCQYGACWEADIIVMAVPRSTYKEVAEVIEEVATQKIVISIDNSTDETTGDARADAAEELKELLPNSKIVKVFSTDFTKTDNGDKQMKAFLAGDNENALEVASELIRTAGFEPVIAEAFTN